MNVGDTVVTKSGPGMVVSVSDDAMTIRVGDQDVTIHMAASKPVRKSHSRNYIPKPKKVCDPIFDQGRTLGFLFATATLSADIPSDKVMGIAHRYEDTTLSSWDSPYVHLVDNKWGSEMRIHVDATAEQVEQIGLTKFMYPRKVGDASGGFCLDSNRVWWALVDRGFRLGCQHERETILHSLHESQRELFDAGVASIQDETKVA